MLNKAATLIGYKLGSLDGSTDAVNCYEIQPLDGEICHLENFVTDDETWAIRYRVGGTQTR